MDIILLERVARLGNVGDVVTVKDGFGRNFLLPEGKALRATKANKEAFEAQREALEKQNADRKAVAEKQAKTLKGQSVKIVRQASEDGRLFGSVNARDVEKALQDAGHDVPRRMIRLNDGIKELGLYQATLALHAEVVVELDIQVVRNLEASAYDEIAKEEAASAEDVAEEATADEGEEAA